MKKNLFLTALLALMMLSAVACGKREEDSSVQPPVTSENSELSEAPEAPEASETPESSENPESSEIPETSETPETSEGGEKEEIYYTVTFDSDGGSEVASTSVLEGEKVAKPTDPKKSSSTAEYEFLYWEYDGKEWDFENDVVVESITLVAKWKVVNTYTPPFLPND